MAIDGSHFYHTYMYASGENHTKCYQFLADTNYCYEA